MVSVERWLVLDAMGVLYEEGDDLRRLLIPFLRTCGATLSDAEIGEVYLQASTGELTDAELWRACGVDVTYADYVTGYRLMPGVFNVLDAAVAAGYRLACLSNDVSEWSRWLRHRFDLEGRIERWFISGDLGVRKPDAGAYLAVLDGLGVEASQCIFIDDRARNVDAAIELGMRTIHLGSAQCPTVAALTELLERRCD